MSRVLRYIDSLYNDVTTLSSMSYYPIHIQITDLFIACYSEKDVWKKVILNDYQAQGEKYDSDNSKILDNFSESIGNDFVMYFGIFSIICVPVYL